MARGDETKTVRIYIELRATTMGQYGPPANADVAKKLSESERLQAAIQDIVFDVAPEIRRTGRVSVSVEDVG